MSLSRQEIQARYRQKRHLEILKKSREYKNRNREKIREAGRLYRLSKGQTPRPPIPAELRLLKPWQRYKIRHPKEYLLSQQKQNARQSILRKERYKTDLVYRQKAVERANARRCDPAKRPLIAKYKKEWAAKKMREDPLFRLSRTLRRRIWMALKGGVWSAESSTHFLLGANFEVVRKWIESKFLPEMNWENHGKWHIDHVIPLSSAKNESELIPLFHYKNLQPLWAIDNLRKHATWPI